MLKNLTGKENIVCSLKYQVLSQQTAMVGVLRQEKKETGEMEFYEIQMGRNLNVEQPKEDNFVPSKYRGNDLKAEFKEKI